MFEKVNPSHPDKCCDRIAGAIVDLAYQIEENPKIAVEVLLGHGICHVIIETSVYINESDIEAAITRIAGDDVIPEILQVEQDTHLADNQKDGVRCGDNGIFKVLFSILFTPKIILLTSNSVRLRNQIK